MYVPAAFEQPNTAALQTLAANHPLATLVVSAPGSPLINHIPLLWRGDELHGHIAKTNELSEALRRDTSAGLCATAVFHGPNGYVSPSDYPSKHHSGKVVPTWNYAVVHVAGRLSLNTSPAWLREQIDALTAQEERKALLTTTAHDALPPTSELWTLDDAPEPFAQALQRAIVGITLAITSVQGKFKLSQNRSDEDQQGAQDGLVTRGAVELATLMRNG